MTDDQPIPPSSHVLPTVALAVVIVLALASIAVLVIARGAGHASYGGPVETPGVFWP